MRGLAIGALYAALLPNPALADMTADYGPHWGSELKFEIADNGNIRVNEGEHRYTLLLDGKVYVVDGIGYDEPPRVRRLEDVLLVSGEEMVPIIEQGRKELPEQFALSQTNRINYTPRGELTINGRKGVAYYWVGVDDGQPEFVISSDPSLLPLQRAVAWFFHVGFQQSPVSFINPHFEDGEQDVLKTGAPITLRKELELETVSDAPIDPRRFDLPSAPQTLEQVRKDPPQLFRER